MRSIKTIVSIGDGPANGGWVRISNGMGSGGEARYVVQSGDSLSSIARAFLADARRWPEIWHEQPDAFRLGRGGNPEVLNVGEVLRMPHEAELRAVALGFLSPSPFAPAIAPSVPTPIAPPAVPSSPTSPPSSPSSSLMRAWSLAGVALGVGTLGAIAYALWKSPPEPMRR